MDFNDINSRLERLYSALHARYDSDIAKHVNLKHVYSASGLSAMYLSFDKGMVPSDALNKIITIIHSLANLKDHLKNILKGHEEDIKCVEEQVDQSLFLQVAIDISNQDKHGYPLTQTRRSKKDPQITNLRQVLSFTSSGPESVSSFQINAQTGKVKTQGDVKTAITADIIDSGGSLIFSLDNLIEGAIGSWEEFMKRKNIISS